MEKIYLEDLVVGATDVAGPYELTRDEIVDFAARYDPEPFHTDEQAAASSVFGGLTASSAHLFAIAYALSHRRERRPAAVAALGIEEMEFPNPARPGDSLSSSRTIVDKRESKTRSDRGIVRVHTVVSNQHGEPVVDYKLKLMVARRGR